MRRLLAWCPSLKKDTHDFLNFYLDQKKIDAEEINRWKQLRNVTMEAKKHIVDACLLTRCDFQAGPCHLKNTTEYKCFHKFVVKMYRHVGNCAYDEASERNMTDLEVC